MVIQVEFEGGWAIYLLCERRDGLLYHLQVEVQLAPSIQCILYVYRWRRIMVFGSILVRLCYQLIDAAYTTIGILCYYALRCKTSLLSSRLLPLRINCFYHVPDRCV